MSNPNPTHLMTQADFVDAQPEVQEAREVEGEKGFPTADRAAVEAAARIRHKRAVRDALRQGQPIPVAVLAPYHEHLTAWLGITGALTFTPAVPG